MPSATAIPLSRLTAAVRRLGDAITYPHGVDRYLELVSPLLVRDEIRARIETVRTEAPGCTTLVLRPNRAWRRAEAGQHVRVGLEIDGVRHTRRFSVASSAHRRDGRIELTVKANPEGRVSRYLVHRARPGGILHLAPAAGEFTLPVPRPSRLLLISGGSGITPVMAMLRTLCDEGHTGRVDFLHYARSREDALFAGELEAIAARRDNVRMRVVHTREGRKRQRFGRDHLPADYADCATYACGPAPLVEAVRGLWDEAGLSPRLRCEFFHPPAPADAGTAGGGRVRFARSDLTVDGDGRPLLEQAEGAGLQPVHGCRMGICHSCTCRKTAGTVRDLQTGHLSSAAEEEIRICVSAPVGEVTLEL